MLWGGPAPPAVESCGETPSATELSSLSLCAAGIFPSDCRLLVATWWPPGGNSEKLHEKRTVTKYSEGKLIWENL